MSEQVVDTGDYPPGVLLGFIDLNGDGNPDIVVTGSAGEGDNVYGNATVLLGNGQASFGVPVTYSLEASVAAESGPELLTDGHGGIYLYDADRFVEPGASPTYVLLKDNGTGSFYPSTTPVSTLTFLPTKAASQEAVPGDTVTLNTVPFANSLTTITVSPAAGSGYEAVTLPPPSLAVEYMAFSATVVAQVGAHFTLLLVGTAGPPIYTFETYTGSFSEAPGEPGVPCYCRGTRILTKSGEVAVEDLHVGEMLVTRLGLGPALMPIRWLGHRRINLKGHPQPDEVSPVRIHASAFGEGKPRRDLLVSPGHRLHLDDTLVRAIDLVNGATIVQETSATVEYWHVELDAHHIIVADGVEAESYQDTGNRGGFDNGSVTTLRPAFDDDCPQPCLPYGIPSASLRESISRRAEALGWSRTRDPAPWLEVNGTQIEPVRRSDRYRFALPTGCVEVRLRSRAGAPCQTNAVSDDTRRLGLSLIRMTLVGPSGALEVPLDHRLLDEGFSHVEHEEGWSWRWTDGDALLPVQKLSAGARVATLEVTLDRQELMFWVPPCVIDDAVSQLSA